MKIMRCCLLVLLLFPLLTINAQSVADMFVSMPAAKTPYLPGNLKAELVDSYKMGTGGKVTNKMLGETSIDTLSADYGHFLLSAAKELTLVRLPHEAGDSVFLCVETYKAPEAQSTVGFYDHSWKCLPRQDKLPDMDVDSMIVRPDTMDIATFEKLQSLLSPKLVSYEYDPASKSMSVNLSAPFLSDDEKGKLEAIICKRKLRWNGSKFN